MTTTPTWQRWAEFRLSVIGHLLAAPPRERGELRAAIVALAARTWAHPTTGEPVHFAASTIEHWLYRARRSGNPDTLKSLGRRRRSDAGRTVVSGEVDAFLAAQYREHSSWSTKLHFDNLRAAATRMAELRPLPSYQTIRRHLQRRGLHKARRRRGKDREGMATARARLEQRETRAFECPYVGGLFHLDFHKFRRQIVTQDGRNVTPLALAILDDRSRLCCHVQWYLTETAQDLVHGFSQALMRRGLPRSLMTDNGAAMVAEEFAAGLSRLGVTHETTLPYSPHQNGKVERFWGQVEGRLGAMLESVEILRLAALNEATLAWVEHEYNATVHGETGETPTTRFLAGPSVLRPSPTSAVLKDAFRLTERRVQRRGDGTVIVEGVRFEVPSAFRHLRDIQVRYARWDLGHVSLVDPGSGEAIAVLTPLDKASNADGRRRTIVPSAPQTTLLPDLTGAGGGSEIPPLLQDLLAKQAATGLPAPYLPQHHQ